MCHPYVCCNLSGFCRSHTWSKPFTLCSYSFTCYSGQIAVEQVQEVLALSMPALLNVYKPAVNIHKTIFLIG